MQYESYLSHHGVDGQQWGIRNGPPYPLDRKGRRALRKQKKQAKKSLAKAVAAESVNDYFVKDVERKMSKAKTKEEYKKLEKEFDKLTKQNDTLHKNTQEKASELLKMNAGKNIKYANYKLYTKYNAPQIKSAKNIIKQYNILKGQNPALMPFMGGAIGGAIYGAVDAWEMSKIGKKVISQYINSENLHNG